LEDRVIEKPGAVDSRPPAHPHRVAWCLAMLAPLFSLFVIRPWAPSAFPVWDYDYLLPILRKTHGVWDAVTAINRMMRADGRANYLTHAQLALTWRLSGDDPLGWQWQRALFMLAAAVLIVLVARRLGASPLAAALAAALFTVAVPSTEGWLFIMAEPLALILLLLLALTAAGYSTVISWRGRAAIIALLALGVMLSK
jgi:hypothetical protein